MEPPILRTLPLAKLCPPSCDIPLERSPKKHHRCRARADDPPVAGVLSDPCGITRVPTQRPREAAFAAHRSGLPPHRKSYSAAMARYNMASSPACCSPLSSSSRSQLTPWLRVAYPTPPWSAYRTRQHRSKGAPAFPPSLLVWVFLDSFRPGVVTMILSANPSSSTRRSAYCGKFLLSTCSVAWFPSPTSLLRLPRIHVYHVYGPPLRTDARKITPVGGAAPRPPLR